MERCELCLLLSWCALGVCACLGACFHVPARGLLSTTHSRVGVLPNQVHFAGCAASQNTVMQRFAAKRGFIRKAVKQED